MIKIGFVFVGQMFFCMGFFFIYFFLEFLDERFSYGTNLNAF